MSDDTSWLEHATDEQVESPRVERKSWCDAAEVARQISGFANGQPPGGLLVVGATRDGKLDGVAKRGQAAFELAARWPSSVSHARVEHRFVPIRDGADQLLYVWVPFTSDRVTTLADGSAYRREGSSVRRLRDDEIRELRDARHETRFEDEPVALWSEVELDRELTSSLVEGMRLPPVFASRSATTSSDAGAIAPSRSHTPCGTRSTVVWPTSC